MTGSFYRALVVASLLVATLAAPAQQTSIAEIASGKLGPATVKIADLSSDFRAVRLRLSGETTSSPMGGYSGLMLMSGLMGGPHADRSMAATMEAIGLNDLLWTKGETATIGDARFLIAYRLSTGPDVATMTAASPKLSANLSLYVVRVDSIAAITPVPEVTPDSMRKTLSAAGVVLDKPAFDAGASPEESTTAAILVPVFARARMAARETSALSNAKQIALSALMYTSDYDDVFPYVESTPQFQRVVRPYTKTDDLWKTLNPRGGALRFAMNLGGVSATAIPRPSETPLIYESDAWPDGRRAVAFVDGHAKRVGAAEWTAIEKRLRTKYPRVAKRPIGN